MLRIERSTLAKAWICVQAMMRDPTAIRAAMRSVENEPDGLRILNAVGETDPEGDLKLADDIKSIVLSKGNYDDGRVIDLILEAINRSYTRNTLDGGFVEAIRDALLTPGDRSKLTSMVSKVEGLCAGCGKRFIEGEVAVYGMQGHQERRGAQVVFSLWHCTRCVGAYQQACQVPGCHESVPLPQKVISVLSNANLKCPTHRAKDTEEYRNKGKEKGPDVAPPNWHEMVMPAMPLVEPMIPWRVQHNNRGAAVGVGRAFTVAAAPPTRLRRMEPVAEPLGAVRHFADEPDEFDPDPPDREFL